MSRTTATVFALFLATAMIACSAPKEGLSYRVHRSQAVAGPYDKAYEAEEKAKSAMTTAEGLSGRPAMRAWAKAERLYGAAITAWKRAPRLSSPPPGGGLDPAYEGQERCELRQAWARQQAHGEDTPTEE